MARGDKAFIRSFLHPMYVVDTVCTSNEGLPAGSFSVVFIVTKKKRVARKTKK